MKITELVRGPMVRLMNHKKDVQLYVQAEYGPDDIVFITVIQPNGTASIFECKMRLINQYSTIDK